MVGEQYPPTVPPTTPALIPGVASPDAPLRARADTTMAWKGWELLMSGGQAGTEYLSDGAPTFGGRSVAPPRSIPANPGLVGVWAGRQLLVWGGESAGDALDDRAGDDSRATAGASRRQPLSPPPGVSGRLGRERKLIWAAPTRL